MFIFCAEQSIIRGCRLVLDFTAASWSMASHSVLLSSKISQVPVAYQFATLFIPETEGERFEAGKQRDRLHRLKQRLRFVALLQVIIRNPRAEMMNVMKPDVARKPLQHLGQFVERTALQRRPGVIPVVATFPVNVLELMLHVKQPHACRAGH